MLDNGIGDERRQGFHLAPFAAQTVGGAIGFELLARHIRLFLEHLALGIEEFRRHLKRHHGIDAQGGNDEKARDMGVMLESQGTGHGEGFVKALQIVEGYEDCLEGHVEGLLTFCAARGSVMTRIPFLLLIWGHSDAVKERRH